MSNTSDTVFLRPLADSDSLEELTDLLHRSYKALADMGLRYMATHQDIGITRRRISDGTCWVAVIGEQIVGTITYHNPAHTKGSPFMEHPEVAHISQLGVEPDFQRRGIATQLMNQAEKQARDDGASEIALDTAESAGHLIDWYKRAC
ncbi:MAG: GNAT family N-acetyltransferase [Candidatus Zixiibacteriota bacterium]|nr:MAG: GNAT family N-acetyltransferase [candidate division Zixibacteria bacterium]